LKDGVVATHAVKTASAANGVDKGLTAGKDRSMWPLRDLRLLKTGGGITKKGDHE
jgi:hypothetical protein